MIDEVFVVIQTDYDYTNISGAFSSEEKAQDYIDSLNSSYKKQVSRILKFKLNEVNYESD